MPEGSEPMKTQASESDCVARARKLATLLAANAARMEADREIAPDVLAALCDAGLFRMLLPRSCGGLEADPLTFAHAVEELAKADGSTAWCVVQASGCSMAAAYLAPEIALEVFGDPRAVLAWGPLGSEGKAVAVKDGYRASGTWSFASGIKHATWLGCHCPLIGEDARPVLSGDGRPLDRTLLFPRGGTAISDIWKVIGLRATGSDAYSIADLFVPEVYSFTRESAADRRERGPLYRFTSFHLYGIGFAAIALGLARASLDAFIALAATKTPKTKTSVLRDNAVVQSQVALAEAGLASSRSFLMDMLRECWEIAVTADNISLPQRAMLKLAGTYAIHASKDVVDTAYHAAGATAIFDVNAFERRFRDMHTLIQQVQAQFANFETVGQVLLGLPSTSRLI
jgi:alkylation response protein AidB-like acyl-CoA dehydrogenase